MTEGVYPVEREVVSVAQALQPVIGRVAVHRLAVLTGEQSLGRLPFVAHIHNIIIPLGLELFYKFKHLGRESNYSVGFFCFRRMPESLFARDKVKATPHNPRLSPLHVICLPAFRHITVSTC